LGGINNAKRKFTSKNIKKTETITLSWGWGGGEGAVSSSPVDPAIGVRRWGPAPPNGPTPKICDP